MKQIKVSLLIWATLAMLSVPSFAKPMLTEATVPEATVNYLSEPPLFPITHNKRDCEDAGCEWFCGAGMPPSPACCWC